MGPGTITAVLFDFHRTLMLPRTEGPIHGLDAVVRIAGA
jgi:hypothetical protein